MNKAYETDADVYAVVKGFEECTTDKAEFTHVSHLTVATFYLSTETPENAFQKMRAGLLHFLEHRGVAIEKYRDDVTRDWLSRVRKVLAEMDSSTSLVTVTNAVIAQLGDSPDERK
jgi:hypothetical protein